MMTKQRIGRFDYSKLNFESAVEVPLFGRTARLAQQTVHEYCRRHKMKVVTRVVDGKLYAILSE